MPRFYDARFCVEAPGLFDADAYVIAVPSLEAPLPVLRNILRYAARLIA